MTLHSGKAAGLAIGLLAFLGGCQASTVSRLAQDGATAQADRLARVARALTDGVRDRGLVFEVRPSDEVGAFAWPEGRVGVTRGLMERLESDAEVAAAVAHELGHLSSDGYLKGAVSLQGSDQGLDEEARADALGVRLMAARGFSPGAMASMLRKVRASGDVPADLRESLDRRIALLAARY